MVKKNIKINRAPVLTLWAAVVAERLGYKGGEALTLAKAVAGLNAQSKGKRLGIYEEKKVEPEEREKKEDGNVKLEFVELLGRGIPVIRTAQGLRASIKGELIEPESVQSYLEKKFGADLDAARASMEQLAKAYTHQELRAEAFKLYEKFRPNVPEGKKGWGVKGELDLDYVRSLSK
jgi:hypothetical protein